MNVPVVSHLKLLVNLYNKMNNRFLVLLVIYLIIYLLSVLYKNKQIFCAILLSLLSWERGLKCHQHINPDNWMVPSLLSWERGLKYVKEWKPNSETESLLSWERGLKSFASNEYDPPETSLLSWERGLKSDIRDVLNKYAPVAPLVGAWIEIE